MKRCVTTCSTVRSADRSHFQHHPASRPRRPCRGRLTEKKNGKSKLIIQLMAASPAGAGGAQREEGDRHRHLPFDRAEPEKAPRGGGRTRCRRPRAHCPHQPRRRKCCALSSGCRCRGHGRPHCRRSAAPSRQDDAGRRDAAMLGFNYTRLDIEKSRSFGLSQSAESGRGQPHASMPPGHDEMAVSPRVCAAS